MNGDNYGSKPTGKRQPARRLVHLDPRHPPAGGVDQSPEKVLVDGSRSALKSPDQKPRYNPSSPSQPHSPSLPNIREEGTIHHLVERAMADTIDFEGQSYEEAEELKKEYSVFLNRIQEAKRKFTLQDTEKRLQNLNNRLRDMILQANPDLCLDMPPQPPLNEATTQAGTRIQAHLTYLESSLEAMDSARTKALQTVEKNIYDANEGLEDLNLQLYTILGTSNVKRLPTIPPLLSSSDENLQARIAYLGVGLDHIEQQIKRSTEEKSILSIQIQQQRELKTKSDSERDTRISSLTQELTKAKKSLTAAQEEARSRSEELVLITEQLNYVRQDAVREEQRYGSSNGIAEKATNEKLTAELKLKQDRITTLENEAATQSKELKDLEGQVVRAQTELTVVRAELDGSRAQRAADISANPANQKEIDRLNKRNAELRKELERLKTQPETPVPAETTSTMVLKNEFRKMMRDTRAENIKALRAEQDERRRLEDVIRSLKQER